MSQVIPIIIPAIMQEWTKVKVRIRGFKPYFMNPKTAEHVESMRKGTRPVKRKDWTPEDEAATKLSHDDNDIIGIPGDNLFSCLKKAGRNIPLGDRSKKNISTAESTLLTSFLFLIEDFIPFYNGAFTETYSANGHNSNGMKWVADVRGSVNPQGGEGIAVTRPVFYDWGLEFHILVNTNRITLDRIKALIMEAGLTQGLGDWRPGKGGRRGTFELAEFESVK